MAKKPLEMTGITRQNKLPVRGSVLKEIESRTFDGGLNVVDSGLQMSSRFSTHAKNVYRGNDAAINVRCGSICLNKSVRSNIKDLVNFLSFDLPARPVLVWTGSVFKLKVNHFIESSVVSSDSTHDASIKHLNGWLRLGCTFRFAFLESTLVSVLNPGVNDVPNPFTTTMYFVVTAIDSDGTISFLFTEDTASPGATAPIGSMVATSEYHFLSFNNRNKVSWEVYNKPLANLSYYSVDDKLLDRPVVGYVKGLYADYIEYDQLVIESATYGDTRYQVNYVLSVESNNIKLYSWERKSEYLQPTNFPALTLNDDSPYVDIILGHGVSTSTATGKISSTTNLSQIFFSPYGIGGSYSFNLIDVGTVTFAKWQQLVLIASRTNKLLLFDFKAEGRTTGTAKVRPVSDPVTGTVNVPSGDIVHVSSNRVLVAGTVASTVDYTSDRIRSVLFISAKNAYSVFVADDTVPGPATEVDFSQIINTGNPEITAVSSFRDFIVICFSEAIVLGRIVEGGDPTDGYFTNFEVVDTVYDVGCIGPNCIVSTGEDLFIFDRRGLYSLKKSLFSGVIQNNFLTKLITPLYNEIINRATSSAALRNSFAYYVTHSNQLIFHLGKDDYDFSSRSPAGYATEQPDILSSPVLVYSTLPGTSEVSWSEYSNMAYQCATIDSNGLVLYGCRENIYVTPGFPNQKKLSYKPFEPDLPVFFDYYDTPTYVGLTEASTTFLGTNSANRTKIDMFAIGSTFDATLSAFGYQNKIYSGPVPFLYTLPSTDFGEKFKIKRIKYINLEIDGTIENNTIPHTDPKKLPYICIHIDGTHAQDESFCVFDNFVRFLAYVEPGGLTPDSLEIQSPFPPTTFYKTASGGIPVYRYINGPNLIPLGLKCKSIKFSFSGFAPQKTLLEDGQLRLLSIAYLYTVGGIRK